VCVWAGALGGGMWVLVACGMRALAAAQPHCHHFHL